MRCIVSIGAATVVVMMMAESAFSQALPPPRDRRPTRASTLAPGVSEACKVLPLRFTSTPEEATDYYAKANGILAMEQVKLIASSNQKAISADWLTAFVSPFRVAAGTTVTDTSDKAGGNDITRTPTETAADDVMAHFTQGGDLYFTAALPLFSCLPSVTAAGTRIRVFLFALPRLGLVAPALGTNTPSEVTEYNVDLGVEPYVDWGNENFKVFAQARFACSTFRPPLRQPSSWRMERNGSPSINSLSVRSCTCCALATGRCSPVLACPSQPHTIPENCCFKSPRFNSVNSTTTGRRDRAPSSVVIG